MFHIAVELVVELGSIVRIPPGVSVGKVQMFRVLAVLVLQTELVLDIGRSDELGVVRSLDEKVGAESENGENSTREDDDFWEHRKRGVEGVPAVKIV